MRGAASAGGERWKLFRFIYSKGGKVSEEMWILFACNGDNINFNMTFGHGEYPFAGRVWSCLAVAQTTRNKIFTQIVIANVAISICRHSISPVVPCPGAALINNSRASTTYSTIFAKLLKSCAPHFALCILVYCHSACVSS